MKKIIRNILNGFGFDVIRLKTKLKIDNVDLSSHLSNVFAAKEIDCVIDVGANSGQYGAFLRKMGFKGYIISFEPVKAVFDMLVSNAKSDNKWICYNLALGDQTEEKTINVYKSSVWSSFLDANAYSKNIWKSLESVIPETVKVAKLDDIFPELVRRTGCKRYFLKMDTQGYDKNVFSGSLDSLANIEALQSELALIQVYDGMPSAYDVLGDFHSRNFYISGMYPINRDESLAVIEYDCVLVKKPI